MCYKNSQKQNTKRSLTFMCFYFMHINHNANLPQLREKRSREKPWKCQFIIQIIVYDFPFMLFLNFIQFSVLASMQLLLFFSLFYIKHTGSQHLSFLSSTSSSCVALCLLTQNAKITFSHFNLSNNKIIL